MGDCAYLNAAAICVPGENTQGAQQSRHENAAISVSPVHIKFSVDNLQDHVASVTLWNKTRGHVRFRIIQPQTDIFQVHCDQQGLYANSSTQFHVKCKPQGIRICVDSLEIHVQGHCPIRVILELLPNVDWFVLPKFISLPPAPLCTKVEVRIDLPMVRGSHSYNFSVISPVNQFFAVTPRSGTIGGLGGAVKFLTVSFEAHEYLTLTYKLKIKFPGVDSQPYEVEVFGRCVPNLTSGAVRRDAQEIEKLANDLQDQLQKKDSRKKEPRMRLVKTMEPSTVLDDDCGNKNLLTPAGIMNFLLHKGPTCDTNTMLAALGVELPRSTSAYQDRKEEFLRRLNRQLIRQSNLLFQYHKEFIGNDSIEAHPEFVEQVKLERERFLDEYQKAVGLRPNESEDVSRTKIKKFNQRQIRPVNFLQQPDLTNLNDPKENPSQSKQLKKAILKPFVQTARLIITRWRVNERLKKLRHLVAEKRRQIQMEETERHEKELEVRQHVENAFRCFGDFEGYRRDSRFYGEMHRLREEFKNKELRGLIDRVISQLLKLRQNVNEDLQRIKGSIKESHLVPPPSNQNSESEHKNDTINDLTDEAAAIAQKQKELEQQMSRLHDTIHHLQEKLPPPVKFQSQKKNLEPNPLDEIELKQIHQARINQEIENLLGSESPLPDKYKKEEEELKAQLEMVIEALQQLQNNISSEPLEKFRQQFNNEIGKILGTLPLDHNNNNQQPGQGHKNLSGETQNVSLSTMYPEKLEELLKKVNKGMDKIGSKYKTSKMTDVRDGVNQIVRDILDDLEDESRAEKKRLKKQLKDLNHHFDRLQNQSTNPDLAQLQNELNAELASHFPDGFTPHASRKFSGKSRATLTGDQIRDYLKQINKELNEIPEEFNTPKIQEIREKVKSMEEELINNPKLKLEADVNNFKDKFNQEVENFQDYLISDLKRVASGGSVGGRSDKSRSSQGTQETTQESVGKKDEDPDEVKVLVSKYEDELSQLENQAISDIQRLQEKEEELVEVEFAGPWMHTPIVNSPCIL